MSPALAFGAAVAAVAGAWELLGAVEWSRVTALFAPLMREGVSPTVAERRRLAVLAAGVLAAAGWFVGGPLVAVVAGVAGPVLAGAVLRARRRRFRAALAAAAPTVARALADALSAGHSVRGAIQVVPELSAAARELELGAPTEAVLERLRRRAASPAWDAMVAGILLQRDAGGDLPNLLRDLAAAQEAGVRQERDALAATAQARFTARVVILLPVAAALLAELARPGLLASLVSNPVSVWLTVLALTFQALALVAVRRLAR